ncbi:DUF3645 domain-containing protein, partial [archaeon]
KKAKRSAETFFSISKIRSLLGLGGRGGRSAGEMTADEVAQARTQLVICDKIFDILRDSVEIMDEVDIILHPLKSELNWPLGAKEPLDFTRSRAGNGLRWSLPSHLLDAIFSVCDKPIIADIADSRTAVEILGELRSAVAMGFDKLLLQSSPHFALLSKEFYHTKMRGVLARWLLLWLRARKVPTISDAEILEFLSKGQKSSTVLLERMKKHLQDEHIKMLNLGHDWLASYLPFILQKINRVHFGLLQPDDLKLLEDQGVKVPTSRKLVAVPFIAKDVPSRASEFAHPDVVIGLTILAYRYEGLRKKDFFLMLKFLRETLEDEAGPYKDRPSFQKFEHWILLCGKAIRGSRKRLKNKKKPAVGSATGAGEENTTSERVTAMMKPTKQVLAKGLFGTIFDIDDDLIWPLQLIDLRDNEQFRILYPLLYKLPHVVMYYLNDLIFPEVLAYQGLKLSACGQELGGDLLFGKKIGFSGTPSDILPLELGSCHYERGSDGRVVEYLTSTNVMRTIAVPKGWDAKSILKLVATAQPSFHALIDTGALITGMSNKAAAEYMLQVGLVGLKGVVYLDEEDKQMVILRKGLKVVKLVDCGLTPSERFSFYDQVHTTGMDIKQAVDANAALTLGKDMTFRDYAQGAFRMRGIGKGQTITLLVIPEVHDLISKQVSMGITGKSTNIVAGNMQDLPIFLTDVISWLVINSMRVDSIQYNLLCEQSVGNIWRKRCFAALLTDYRSIDSVDKCPPILMRALQIFRERIDFEIENSIPTSIMYSEKIAKHIDAHGDILSVEMDRKTADYILALIRDEETKSEALKAQAAAASGKQTTDHALITMLTRAFPCLLSYRPPLDPRQERDSGGAFFQPRAGSGARARTGARAGAGERERERRREGGRAGGGRVHQQEVCS